jgi:hypothetical protein
MMKPCPILAAFLLALVGCADQHDSPAQALDPEPAVQVSSTFAGPAPAPASAPEAPNLVSDPNELKLESAVPAPEAAKEPPKVRRFEAIVRTDARNPTDTEAGNTPQDPRPAETLSPEQSKVEPIVPSPASGPQSDPDEAITRYRKAAEQGSADAQFRLGTIYYFGQGIPQDYQEAAIWYRKAAEQGSAYAQFNLGIMYYRGLGVLRDYREAAQWFTRAAEGGHTKAQYNMAVTYYDGQGVLEDYVEAYKWALLASMNGSVPARVLGDTLRRIMTPGQLEEAQRRAKTFLGR